MLSQSSPQFRQGVPTTLEPASVQSYQTTNLATLQSAADKSSDTNAVVLCTETAPLNSGPFFSGASNAQNEQKRQSV